MGILMDIGINLLGALAPLIASGLGALIVKGTALVNAKTLSAQQKAANNSIGEVVVTVVQALLQTSVDAAKAASGGKLSAGDAAKYKAQAIDSVAKLIGKDQLDNYAKALGISDISGYIASKIESALYASKQGVVQATTSTSTDSVLPPFYAASAQYPAQVGAGTLVPPPSPNPPPPAVQGVPGR